MEISKLLRGRLALFAAAATIITVAVLYSLTRSDPRWSASRPPPGTPSASATVSSDKCVSCHQRQTPAIVEQWSRSVHAAKQTSCGNCHEVTKDYPGAKEHYGAFVSSTVTPATCAKCHPNETKQYDFSRHSIPAWTALVGYPALNAAQKARFNRISEIRPAPGGGELPTGFVGATRNALYDLEGAAITKMACQSCHSIGRPNADGSVGNCNACHLRHDFSLAQVRKPETCSHCHIGPDHPQYEIYEESAHGILYHTQGHDWNWTQKKGRLGVADFPAATCQICHMSAFGAQPTTHDVGDRLSWFLFAETSSKRPNSEENRERMKSVCSECHSRPFINEEYSKADALTEAVNLKTEEAKKIMEDLFKEGLMTDKPFDAPIKFAAFDLWHHYGRTAKFGAWMQGPDYTQWHGIYPLMKELENVKAEAAKLRTESKIRGSAAGDRPNRP